MLINSDVFAQMPVQSGTPITVQIHSPGKDTIDYLLFAIQVITLIGLYIYVYKTWYIAVANEKSAQISERVLSEMQATREQEIEPYVVAYFDIV